LHRALTTATSAVKPLLAQRRYTEALTALAGLRVPVDRFFDKVMVMTEDQALQRNRLALLSELRDLFLDIADISQLSIA
jgi:glycyl-tRNA synthetase beta chain